MTISARKIEANRRNARRSTGPRTPEGKARSRMNAVTHGLTGQILLLPDDDPRVYQQRLDDWVGSLELLSDYERGLVQRAAGLSWRLDRADRVLAKLIARSIAQESDAEVRRRQESLGDATRRLCPELAPPGPEATASHRPARPAGPDDPNDPLLLVMRLERSADGCRWLLDRWAELRAVVATGTAWDADQMTRTLNLLGKRPLDAADDHQVLTIVVACFALDRARPDPFAALWEGLSAREVEAYRRRLIGRRLREAMPASPDEARDVLLEVVDEAIQRLEDLARALRGRETARTDLRPTLLLFDDTPEGRWLRARQFQYDHAILRIIERFRKARRRGEPMTADPPRKSSARSPSSAAPPQPPPDPVRARRDEMAAARRRRGRKWRTYKVPPHRAPGGRRPSRKEYNPRNPRPKSRRRQTPEQIRKTAQRFVQLFRWLGLLLLIALPRPAGALDKSTRDHGRGIEEGFLATDHTDHTEGEEDGEGDRDRMSPSASTTSSSFRVVRVFWSSESDSPRRRRRSFPRVPW